MFQAALRVLDVHGIVPASLWAPGSSAEVFPGGHSGPEAADWFLLKGDHDGDKADGQLFIQQTCMDYR